MRSTFTSVRPAASRELSWHIGIAGPTGKPSESQHVNAKHMRLSPSQKNNQLLRRGPMLTLCHRTASRTFWLRLLLCAAVLLPLCWPSPRGSAQSGVLVPLPGNKPDLATLSLQLMNVDVLIDNQHARVKVMQIFDSHAAQVLEGKYLFALPPGASIFDFAVWDTDLRIPGVMMEKRRANQVYSDIKQQQIDPGLLQQDDEHEGTSAFSARVFPIPAYGTKRIELEYTEMLPVESLTSHFTFPLKSSFGEVQRVEEFNLHLHVLSDYPIAPQVSGNQSYPLTITKAEANDF